ncbi:ATP-binding protein [Pseudoalteromonas elyakovii]|nr:ATP-binding protein [Pseudoalteromonas elyakovii]
MGKQFIKMQIKYMKGGEELSVIKESYNHLQSCLGSFIFYMTFKMEMKMELYSDNYIIKIEGKLPNKENQILIDNIDGKNLIVTGTNGCGKTYFLSLLFDSIKSISSNRNISVYSSYTSAIHEQQRILDSIGSELQRKIAQDKIENFREKIEELQVQTGSLRFELKDYILMAEKAKRKLFLLDFFSASRQYRSDKDLSATYDKLMSRGKEIDLSSQLGPQFETYLIAYIESRYLAYAMRKEHESKKAADSWMSNFQSNLQFLFEDPSLKFTYNEDSKKFFIKQDGKDEYDLSKLSSGYSSILSIYSELIIKTEYKGLEPEELSGIVFIDEIDAHLHVSLQKKILPFLVKAYPNIQFIVSTHSPFVLQSVDDAIVYDLTNNEQMEDLSLYSYEAILKGLLGVETKSNELVKLVDYLAELIPNLQSGNTLKKDEALKVIRKLRNVESKLDSKSKVVLLMAEQAIDDLEGYTHV